MIAITVEVWPHGDRSNPQVVGFGAIGNVTGAGQARRATYRATFSTVAGHHVRHGGVANWPRLDRDVWQLVAAALGDALGMEVEVHAKPGHPVGR